MSNRCDCSYFGDEDSYVCFANDVTLINKGCGIWISSISSMNNITGIRSWSSCGKTGWDGNSYSLGITFPLSNVVSKWPPIILSISDMGDNDILDTWNLPGKEMLCDCGSNSWGISRDLGSIRLGGGLSNSNNWRSSENMDGGINITFTSWSSSGYCQEGQIWNLKIRIQVFNISFTLFSFLWPSNALGFLLTGAPLSPGSLWIPIHPSFKGLFCLPEAR